MADFIQDDMNVNLNSVVQVLADVSTDYLLVNQVMARLTKTDMKLNMLTSTVYHIADEILFPAVYDGVEDLIGNFPLVGGWLKRMIGNIVRQEYVKVLLRLILIGILQKTFGDQFDFIEGAVMILSTYSINFAVELEVVRDVLDWQIDF